MSVLNLATPSGSVAVITAPMFVPAAEFSAMLRVAAASANVGGSLTSVTLMVTGTM